MSEDLAAVLKDVSTRKAFEDTVDTEAGFVTLCEVVTGTEEKTVGVACMVITGNVGKTGDPSIPVTV